MREGRNEERAQLAGSAATNSAQLLLAHRSGCGKCGAVKVDHQIGLEPTLAEHIDVMVAVFEEVRRVLKPTGTLWLNYGDCYATSPNGRSAADTKAAGNDDRTFRDKPFSTIGPIGKRITAGEIRADVDVGGWGARDDSIRWRGGGLLKAKDLCMIPNRLAIALQDAGWWVRSEIIWHKPNPMPESIKDRPACSHEKVFLLSKSERYFYDHIAVRQPLASASIQRLSQDVESQEGSDRANGGAKTNGKMKAVRFGGDKGQGDHGSAARRASGNEWNPADDSANLKNVWTIPTASFSDAHFATFPPSRCIKAGSSEAGCCAACGAAWTRQTEITYRNPGNRQTNGPRSLDNRAQTAGFAVRLEKIIKTTASHLPANVRTRRLSPRAFWISSEAPAPQAWSPPRWAARPR
jgi:DNA modification methylase